MEDRYFVYMPPLFLGSNEEALIQRLALSGTKLLECSEKVFAKLSYRDRPDGLIAIAKQKHVTLPQLTKKSTNPFLSLQKPLKNRAI